jgi:hypothetical protein
MDKDFVGKDDFLGEFTVKTSDLKADTTFEQWYNNTAQCFLCDTPTSELKGLR